MISSLMVSVLYFLFSLMVLSFLYFLSRYFSGEKFRWGWFLLCLVLAVFFGSFHMSTVKYGYDIMFPALEVLFKGNDVVGWVAFISIFLHVCCIPTQYEPKRWFSKK